MSGSLSCSARRPASSSAAGLIIAMLACVAPSTTDAFYVQTPASSSQQRLFLSEDSNDPNVLFGGDTLPLDKTEPMPMPVFSIAYSEDDDFHQALKQRSEDLANGIGKRYVVRTQKGFLNVHRQPTTAYDTTNIAGSLTDGDVVVSTGAKRGSWIQHDGGATNNPNQEEANDGWSVIVHGGFTWLEEIDE